MVNCLVNPHTNEHYITVKKITNYIERDNLLTIIEHDLRNIVKRQPEDVM